MKLVRYGAEGQEKPGMIDADGNLRDLSAVVSDIDGAALSKASLAKLSALDVNDLPMVQGDQRFGACVGSIGKFMCIGLNYSDHAAESNLPIPDHPILFMKATSAVVGAKKRIGALRAPILCGLDLPCHAGCRGLMLVSV